MTGNGDAAASEWRVNWTMVAALRFLMGPVSGALTEMLASTLIRSILVHIVPMMGEAGIERATGAAVASTIGIAAIAGKLMTGWILDRGLSWWIPSVNMWLPAVACLLFIRAGQLGNLVFLAAAIFGYALGAYLDWSRKTSPAAQA